MSQQAATWKTSEQQDEFNTLFLPLISVFAPAAGIWLAILAYLLL